MLPSGVAAPRRDASHSPPSGRPRPAPSRPAPSSPSISPSSRPNSTSTLQISPTAQLPVHVLKPSHCRCCGALPSTPNKKGDARRFRRCAQCKSVDYCSDKCQRMDWKGKHKKECLPIAKMRIEATSPPPHQGAGLPLPKLPGVFGRPPSRPIIPAISAGGMVLGVDSGVDSRQERPSSMPHEHNLLHMHPPAQSLHLSPQARNAFTPSVHGFVKNKPNVLSVSEPHKAHAVPDSTVTRLDYANLLPTNLLPTRLDHPNLLPTRARLLQFFFLLFHV